jgi:hypothetical protein
LTTTSIKNIYLTLVIVIGYTTRHREAFFDQLIGVRVERNVPQVVVVGEQKIGLDFRPSILALVGGIGHLLVAFGALAIVRSRSILAQLVAHVRRLLALVDVDAAVGVHQLIAGSTRASEARECIKALVVASVEDWREALVDAAAPLVTIVRTV